MPFIKIIALPNGGKVATSEYFFKNHVVNEKCSIKPGEVAEVPESELDFHLSTGMVMEVRGPDDAGSQNIPRRGRPRKTEAGFEAVYAAQR